MVNDPTDAGRGSVLLDRPIDGSALIDHLNHIIFQIDASRKWRYLSAEWERLTGFSIVSTLGTDFIQHIHPDDQGKGTAFIHDTYQDTSSVSSVRIRFLTKAEHYFWVNMRANTFYDAADDQTYLVGVISDITHRVREYGLHLATHRTLHTLISNLCGLVYRGRNNMDWTMEFVSDGCLELTGYRSSELLNQTVAFGSLIHPDDQELVWSSVQDALGKNRPYELVYRIYTKDHQEKWVWERGKGNFSHSGELLSIEGLIVDISSYKQKKQKASLYEVDMQGEKAFLDRLEVAVERNRLVGKYSFSLLLICIDRLDRLREQFSVDTMDKVILKIGEKIKLIVEPISYVCLFEEGEFAVLLEHTESIHATRDLMKKINSRLSSPIKVDRTAIYLTLSTGIYLSTKDLKDRIAAMRNASKALNIAKSLGGGRYEIFDTDMNAKSYAIDRVEKEIEYAIEKKELKVLYQPIKVINRHTAALFEAQIFWAHPRQGDIPAALFLSSDNSRSTISRLDQYLINIVTNQSKHIPFRGHSKHKPCITIPLYGGIELDNELLEYIAQRLLDFHFDGLECCIIIAEKSLYALSKNSLDRLIQLHEDHRLGLVIEADQAILSYNERLHITAVMFVKIKASLAQLEDRRFAFLKAQMDYFHAFGKKIILSGIDTQTQLDALSGLAPDYIQGDFIAPPFEPAQPGATIADITPIDVAHH